MGHLVVFSVVVVNQAKSLLRGYMIGMQVSFGGIRRRTVEQKANLVGYPGMASEVVGTLESPLRLGRGLHSLLVTVACSLRLLGGKCQTSVWTFQVAFVASELEVEVRVRSPPL